MEIRLKHGVLNNRNDEITKKPCPPEILRRAISRNQKRREPTDPTHTCPWIHRGEEFKAYRYKNGCEIEFDDTSREKLNSTFDAHKAVQVSPLLRTPQSRWFRTNDYCVNDSKAPMNFLYAHDTADNIVNSSSPIADTDKSKNPAMAGPSPSWTSDYHDSMCTNFVPISSVSSAGEVEEEDMCSRRPSVGEQGPFALRRYLTSKSEPSAIWDDSNTGCMNIPINNDPSDDEIDGSYTHHDYEADWRIDHENLGSSSVLDLSNIPSAEKFWTWDEDTKKYYHLDEGSQSPLWYSWEA